MKSKMLLILFTLVVMGYTKPSLGQESKTSRFNFVRDTIYLLSARTDAPMDSGLNSTTPSGWITAVSEAAAQNGNQSACAQAQISPSAPLETRVNITKAEERVLDIHSIAQHFKSNAHLLHGKVAKLNAKDTLARVNEGIRSTEADAEDIVKLNKEINDNFAELEKMISENCPPN